MNCHALKSHFYCALTGLLIIASGQESSAANANVGGISIKGLSNEQARRRITRGLSSKLEQRIRLSDGRRSVSRRRRDLGVYLAVDEMLNQAAKGQKYVPVRFDVKTSELQNALRRVAPQFASSGSSARVGERRGKVVIAPHQNRRSLNVGASAQSVASQILKNPGAKVLRVNVSENRR
jgi:hypothetical protein